MEGPLSLEECKKVLDTFESDKTPGEDGFTVEFYKTFLDLIGQDLVASLNAAYEANELSLSQRRGIHYQEYVYEKPCEKIREKCVKDGFFSHIFHMFFTAFHMHFSHACEILYSEIV